MNIKLTSWFYDMGELIVGGGNLYIFSISVFRSAFFFD